MANVKTVTASLIDGTAYEAQTGSGHRLVIEGGQKRGPSPMELVLVGLAGCTGIDVVDILKKKRLDVKGLQVRVEGTRAETSPMVYTCIDVIYTVRGKDIPEQAVKEAIRLSEEKYCSVGAMLSTTAQINSRYEIIAE